MSALDQIHSLLASSKRLIKLSFPREDGPASVLLVNELIANEAVVVQPFAIADDSLSPIHLIVLGS